MFSYQNTRKRKLLTLNRKVAIIKMYESGEKVNQMSRKLNLSNSTISSIIKDKKRIMAASKTEAFPGSSTMIRKRHGIIAQTEYALKAWCEQQIDQNVRLSQNDICQQARTMFEELKKEYGEVAKDETFSASKGWYLRFKHRCQTNPTDDHEEENYEEESEKQNSKVKKQLKIEKSYSLTNTEVPGESTFSNNLKTIYDEGLYTPQTVFNVKEIGLYWKKMPKESPLMHQGDIGFNESKDRLTVLLGGNAAGDLKLKPLVVYRMENPRALHKKSKGGLPIIWKANPTASMSAFLFEDWFGHYFIPEVERYCFANNIPCKVLLVVDTAICHSPLTLMDFDHRVKVVFLPSGEASSKQPMIQEIATKFKTMYTRSVFEHLLVASKQSDSFEVKDLWKEFNILNAIRIIVNSWADVNENDWIQSWTKLFPFIDHSRTDIAAESRPISRIVDEIVSFGSELEMKVTKEDIFDLINSHTKELTIEELIEMQEFSSNEELDDQDPLLPEVPMTVENLTEALKHIKMGLQILENIDVNEQRSLTTKLGVLKLLSAYDEILNEKVKSQ